MQRTVLAVVVSTAACGMAQADQIAGNPGFETPGAGATASALWQSSAGGATGTISQRTGVNPFAGGWAHQLRAVGDVNVGASAAVFQNSIGDVGLPSLQPGSSLSLSFRGNYTFGPGGVGFYALRILNGAGTIVAETPLQTIAASTSGYQLFSTSALTVPAFGAAPNDVFAAFVEFSVAAGAFSGSSADGSIDSIELTGTVVPAPASGALLVLGLAMVRRRR